MARSRVIKPEFWSDEKLARVSREARLTFIGLWTSSDDYGVCKAHPSWIKSQLFPYDDSLKIDEVRSWLSELEREKFIFPFESHGENFYYIKSFAKHQKVDKPSKQRNPGPPEDLLTRESVARVSRESGDETETETEDKELSSSGDEVEAENEVDEVGPTQETEKDGIDFLITKKKRKLNGKRFQSFLLFWEAFGYKAGKREAADAWFDLPPLTDAIVKQIVEAAEREAANRSKLISENKTPKMAQGWITGRRWEDEQLPDARKPIAVGVC